MAAGGFRHRIEIADLINQDSEPLRSSHRPRLASPPTLPPAIETPPRHMGSPIMRTEKRQLGSLDRYPRYPTSVQFAGSPSTSQTYVSSNTSVADRQPRAPRPSYSEEQKFFIMFCRIKRDATWEDIERRFSIFFGTERTRGGLTSIYYRIRRSWGLRDVQETDASYFAGDCEAVEQHAKNFSKEFLTQIGYLR